MKEKFKFNPTNATTIIKASLVGVVVSILLVLLFAFILKFVDIGSNTITIVDQAIKIISIAIAVFVLSKSGGNNLLVKGLIVGAIYSIIAFIVFSVLNGGLNWSVAIFTDMVFSALVGGVVSILLNLIRKK